MPLAKGSSAKTVSANIKELHTGKTYAHTAEKFGAKKAQAQSVAIAMKAAGKSKKKSK